MLACRSTETTHLHQAGITGRAIGASVFAALLALALAGCLAGSNKAGGDIVGPARTLTVVSGVGIKQQALEFAHEVARLSNGNLRIRFDGATHPGDPHAEGEIIQDVRQGKVASALVGARVFDTLGINDFQPLIAPLVVDSYALEGAVFAAGIPQEMLQSVSRLGLVGIAILPGPLRRMFGNTQSFLHPSDFAGKVVGIQESALARETFAALGAKAKALPSGASLEGVDGYEQQLDSIVGNGYAKRGTYLTTNLVLWPRPLVLVMGQKAYASLSADQRGVLEEAAAGTVAPALAASRAEDATAMQVLCKGSETLDVATASDVADFRAALAPVYSHVAASPQTREWLERIQGLNRGLPPAAPTCLAPAEQAARPAPRELEGVWKVSISRSEWIDAVGLSDAEVPAGLGGITVKLEFRDGRFLLLGYPDGFDTFGTYTLDGRDLRLQLPVSGQKDTGVWNLTWSVYRGALSLSGDGPYWIGLKPWRRIGDAHASDYVVQPVTSLPPNGVYVRNATVDGFLREGTDLGYAQGNAALYRVAWRDGRWRFVSCSEEPCGGRYWLKGGLLHFAWAHEGPGSTETWSFENGVLSFHHVANVEEIGDLLNSTGDWRKIR